jgi:hypothetical protein
MIQNVGMNAECQLLKQEEQGDLMMFVKVVEISAVNVNIRPLLYRNGKYCRLGEETSKPSADIFTRIEEVAQKNSRVK